MILYVVGEKCMFCNATDHRKPPAKRILLTNYKENSIENQQYSEKLPMIF